MVSGHFGGPISPFLTLPSFGFLVSRFPFLWLHISSLDFTPKAQDSPRIEPPLSRSGSRTWEDSSPLLCHLRKRSGLESGHGNPGPFHTMSTEVHNMVLCQAGSERSTLPKWRLTNRAENCHTHQKALGRVQSSRNKLVVHMSPWSHPEAWRGAVLRLVVSHRCIPWPTYRLLLCTHFSREGMSTIYLFVCRAWMNEWPNKWAYKPGIVIKRLWWRHLWTCVKWRVQIYSLKHYL